MSVPAKGIIIDRYQVEGGIGAGSMGDVVRAVDIDLHRNVAIKILSEKHRDNDELRARFVREGRAVAAISHANVVQVFTTGTYDGRPYIAMEFLTGTDLGTFITRRGTMSSLLAAKAILDAAKGLEAAAKAGLIHRDVKPSNLVMLDSGEVKVTDFGLAKPLDPKSEPALTAMGVVVGTPDYIAPEQARGDTIDVRVDIYALGGSLYYLLTGKPPFRKGNPQDDKYLKVVARHLKDPAPNPMLLVPEVDSELANLQLRMMAKKADARPSYRELIEELETIVARLQMQGRPGTAPATMPPTNQKRHTAPTPFLGRGSSPQAAGTDDADDNRATTVHQKVSPPADYEDMARAATERPLEGTDKSQQGPSKQKNGKRSAQASAQRSAAEPGPRPRRSKGLMVLTTFSALAFAAALGLYLAGPLPGPKKVTAAPPPTIDAGPVATEPDAAPKPIEVPEGMLLLPATKGAGPVLVSKTLVTRGDFSALFPNQVKPSSNKKKQAQAVVGVSFAFAESYARSKGGRLPTEAELRRARELEGFVHPKKLKEWFADETEGTQEPRPVMDADGEISRKRPRGQRDVSFRMALDPQ